MEPTSISSVGSTGAGPAPQAVPLAKLRLYVARSTPNSVRAEHNLLAALDRLQDADARSALEIIDVFSQPKRAITDGVVVTPTLIGMKSDKRVMLMGDLSDQAQLHAVLQDLLAIADR